MKADELLTELLAATDELEGTPIEWRIAVRIGEAQKLARAYLNEKPHEPNDEEKHYYVEALQALAADEADAAVKHDLLCAADVMRGDFAMIRLLRLQLAASERLRGTASRPHAAAEPERGSRADIEQASERLRQQAAKVVAMYVADAAAEPEKPMECNCVMYDSAQCCPIHGPRKPAAEPEKPVAWYMPIGRYGHVHWGPNRPDAGNIDHWLPLYASPSAQPIAREPTEAMLAAMAENSIYISGRDRKGDYDRLRIIWQAAYDAALKSAGKESP